jgi:hypothetical protein
MALVSGFFHLHSIFKDHSFLMLLSLLLLLVVVLGFELKASHLLSKHSNTWATLSALKDHPFYGPVIFYCMAFSHFVKLIDIWIASIFWLLGMYAAMNTHLQVFRWHIFSVFMGRCLEVESTSWLCGNSLQYYESLFQSICTILHA